MKLMHIHKEGYKMVTALGLILLVVNALAIYGLHLSSAITLPLGIFSIVVFLFVVSFFRNPRTVIDLFDNKYILCPADGKIVAIEEVEESEYFKDKRLQVSIFMSPANVHINRTPISGTVKYTKYHPGNYLVAWHPKSSTENERFTSVIQCAENELEIMVRQIAGKVARKISNYLDEGEQVEQGEELGFIKFGSRVDLFLPLGAEVKVDLQQKVKGGKTILAVLPA